MTIMPTGPAPTLEELLLQAEMMRRGGQPIANMFKPAYGPFDPQPVDILKLAGAVAADPYSPVNLDGSRPIPAPVRPAPRPIQQVPVPPSTPVRNPQVQGMIDRMSGPAPVNPYKVQPGAFGPSPSTTPFELQSLYQPKAAQQAPKTAAAIPGNSRGARNNNPGNLEASAWTRKQPGYMGSDGRFAIFDTPENGIRAQETLLRGNYFPGAGGTTTIDALINRYGNDPGPGDDASVANYKAYVARKLGIGVNDVIAKDKVPLLAAAMREFETGNQTGSGAIGAAAGAITGGTGLVNGFDPTYYNQAIGQVDAAMGEALKPQTFDVSLPARPEVPELVKAPPMDFTKQDEWLAKLKPEKDSKATQSAISRRGMFEGLAQGLAGTPEDAHWGKVLANVGAGMLAGRMAGDREVQARLDKFDEKMDQWEALNFANEKEKASLVYNAALKEVDQINNRNMLVFQNNIDDWKMKNNFTIQNGMFIKSTQTDKGVQVTTTPIRSIIAPQMLLQKAQIMSNMAGTANQATIAQQQVINGVIGQAAGIEYQQSKMNDPANMGVEQQVGSIANAVISSNAGARVFGDTGWAEIQNAAKKAALAAGATPGTQQYEDIYNEDLTTSVIANMLETPAFVQQAQELGPLLSATEAARRHRNTTESRSTRRGNTTERETVRY